MEEELNLIASSSIDLNGPKEQITSQVSQSFKTYKSLASPDDNTEPVGFTEQSFFKAASTFGISEKTLLAIEKDLRE